METTKNPLFLQPINALIIGTQNNICTSMRKKANGYNPGYAAEAVFHFRRIGNVQAPNVDYFVAVIRYKPFPIHWLTARLYDLS